MYRILKKLSTISRAWFARIFDMPYLLLPLAPLFWSGNFIVGRAVRAELPPLGLAFWRWCLSALIVLTVARPHLARDWPIIRAHWKILALLSICGIAAFNTLVYTGLQFTSAINGILLQSAIPVCIVAISYLLFRDTITLLQTGGILVSLVGAVVIITQGNLAIFTQFALNVGDLLIIIAVLSYAVYSVLLRKRPALHPLSFLAVTFTLGALILLPLYFWEHLFRQVMPVTRLTLLAVGYVAIFPSIVAYLCYNRGVELLGANWAGLFIHLMPVFGSLMAIVFLGETFRWFHGLGFVLIITGIVFTTHRPTVR
jgi:drug/metabolite transporter (DMT)-like permease